MTFENYNFEGLSRTNTHLVKSVLLGIGDQQGNVFGPSNSIYDLTRSMPTGTTNSSSFEDADILDWDESWGENAMAHIEGLRTLSTNGEYDPPNDLAVKNAKLVLTALLEALIKPNSIGPCPDEGVTFTLVHEEKMSAIETSNSGEIVVVLAEKNENPKVWEISNNESDIQDAVQAIDYHLGI